MPPKKKIPNDYVVLNNNESDYVFTDTTNEIQKDLELFNTEVKKANKTKAEIARLIKLNNNLNHKLKREDTNTKLILENKPPIQRTWMEYINGKGMKRNKN